MAIVQIKPLSVNEAWQGKRFKTKSYNLYEKHLLMILPKLNIEPPPYRVDLHFGFSNKMSDIDNPVKPFLDILQKKYNFNDSDIYELNIVKSVTKKNKEYIEFLITSI